MTITNLTCIDEDLRTLLVELIRDSSIDNYKLKQFQKQLEDSPMCTVESITTTKKGRKGQRPLSPYNIFMSTCLKEKDMKHCVEDWRSSKTPTPVHYK